MALSPDTQRIYQLIIDAGGSKAGAEMFKQAAEKITDASAKAAAAGKPLTDNVAAAEKAFGKLVTKIDPVARAQLELARDIKVVERALASQTISVDEAVQRVGQLGQRYENALARSKGTVIGFGSAVQQAGFQIGDFAVQVASGQGVLRPLIQQGTQLISMFGPWGAVIGAAGAVLGALATSLWEVEDATKAAEDALDAYNEAMKASEALTKALHEANDTNVEGLKAERRYRLELADATLKEAEAKVAVARASVEAAEKATLGNGVTVRGGNSALAGARQQLAAIKAINDDIILQQRKLIAENKYGGEQMDPFANMGGDFTGSYYDPTKKAGSKSKDSGADAIADLQQQIALHGSLTREEKALYETSMGRYKDESAAEKDKILQLARILDLKEALTAEEKKTADLSKKRETAEIAEYDKIIEDASRGWDERVKAGAQLTAEVQTPMERYLATVKELNIALQTGTITYHTYNLQIAKAQDAFSAASEGTKLFRDAANDAMGILQAGLVDAAFEADNLKEALAGVLEQLAKMAANKAFGFIADKGLDAFFSLFGSGPSGGGVGIHGASAASAYDSGGGFFSWLGNLFHFADGGIMTSAGALPLRKYAGGGIANSPQLAMFGEGSTPEAFVPVPSGRIPVELKAPSEPRFSVPDFGRYGGGRDANRSSVVINAPITIEGGAGTPDQNTDLANKMQERLTRVVNDAIDQRMADQQRSGGLLNRSSMGF